MQGVLKIVRPDEPAWQRLHDALPQAARDVFYGPGFARVCDGTIYEDCRVLAATLETPQARILYPFVLRDIGKLLGDPGLGGDAKDITGLYGRGGIVCGGAGRDVLDAFHAEFAGWCRDEGILCGFSRFHPVIDNARYAAPTSRVVEVGKFVVVDLRDSPDEIESRFRYSMQKAIRKGEKAGIRVEVEQTLDHIDDFIDIYHGSLARNDARAFYYFPKSFYAALARELPGRFAFYYGLLDGEIVTCELVLFDGVYGHSFLGGTRPEAFASAANQILKRAMIRDLKQRGCAYYLLGGGQRADDGVYRYKLAYAPDGAMPSRIGGDIYLKDRYDDLRERMTAAGAPMWPDRIQFYDPT